MRIRTSLYGIIVILLSVPAASLPLEAGDASLVYHFNAPRLETGANGYSQLFFPATIQAGKPGEPSFPFRGVQLLLPPGASAAHVRIEKRNWTAIAGKHLLRPMQQPVPGIDAERRGGGLLVNQSAYKVARWIHPPASEFSTHYLRGHSIAVGAFSPVGFKPVSGELGYYREVEVIIETAADEISTDALAFLRTDTKTLRRIAGLVDNPQAIDSYSTSRIRLGDTVDGYEYLIVTRDSVAGDFEPIREFYTRIGLRAEIMTIEDIETGYSGIDTQEKIRNAIIAEYTGSGITHVLLGGDGDIVPGSPCYVPYRGLYASVQSSSFYEDFGIPSDLYYAALDGTWDGDGDEVWGESGEEDFYSEIAVGRACVDTHDEIAHFIYKTIGYQESPVAAEARTAYLFGEQLYSDPLTYGGDELDQLIGTCTAYGFTTTGLPADFDIVKYYERDMGSWVGADVIDAVNSGTNWLLHSGHTNSSYAMHLFSSSVNDVNFTNDGVASGYPIIYTYGCYAGAFDADDCIGEMFVSIGNCAAAFIGNSRYGWFTEGTTNGPSHHFQREFFDAIFSEGLTTLGEANQRSKDETVPFVDLPEEYEPGAHRWCFYALNLLGDPALDAWTDTPVALTAGHAPRIGRSDTLLAVEAGVEGAVGALYGGGRCFGIGIADSYGHIYIHLSQSLPDSLDTIELSVRAHNHLIYYDSLDVVTDTGHAEIMPSLTLDQNIPNPFNPSTRIDFTLPSDGLVDLRVYDVSGRQVDHILRRQMTAGRHTITWRPDGLSSGVYFYVLRAQEVKIVRKAVLLR
jgi:hypothetical protein